MHLGDQADRFGAVLRIGGQEAPVGKRLGQVPGDGDAVGQEAAFGRPDDRHRAPAAEGRDLGSRIRPNRCGSSWTATSMSKTAKGSQPRSDQEEWPRWPMRSW
jgi:hypothetical protein